MQRMMAALGGFALIAGCGPSSAPAPKRPEIKVRGDAQKRLAGLTEMDRAIGLKRAIYDSNNVCKRVVATGFVAEYKNLSMWHAACDDGKDWAIFVAPEGSAQVRPCADLKELKLPECPPMAQAAPHKKTAGKPPAA